jgi:uncharacterized protein YuzE
MKSRVAVDSYLKVRYDRDKDVLYALIPGRKIKVSSEVTPPLIVDFGSEEDGFDVVGFEMHRASEVLAPMLRSVKNG